MSAPIVHINMTPVRCTACNGAGKWDQTAVSTDGALLKPRDRKHQAGRPVIDCRACGGAGVIAQKYPIREIIWSSVAAAGIALAAMSSPASASDHVAIAFRNPVTPQTVATSTRGAMIALQAVDAVTSARCFAHGGHETDWQYRGFSHGGALGMAVGFAAWDLAEHAAARALHLGKVGSILVDSHQAEQSAVGIAKTARLCR